MAAAALLASKKIFESTGMKILSAFGVILLFYGIANIPPIHLPYADAAIYLLPPSIVYNFRFWFWVAMWIMVQVGCIWVYFTFGKFFIQKILPHLKNLHTIHEKVQNIIHGR